MIQPKYEIPYILVEQKIADYCESNDIDEPDWKRAGMTTKDADYLKKLKLKYGDHERSEK